MRLALLLAALPSLALAQPTTDDSHLAQQAAQLIPAFQQQLLGTVKQAVEQGGPAQAVQACQTLAPRIAAEHSQQGWQVARTALRVRNPANRPDAWELQTLLDFQQRAAAGEDLSQMTASTTLDGEFRFMKAIPTGEPCLACHGSEIKAELATLIDQRYPDDQARGFQAGELRGAFSLRRTVENTP